MALETFKARLKAKSTALKANLSNQRIDEISARLHKKFPELTEEKDHDDQIDLLNELTPLVDIAKQDDKIRTLESKPPKQDPPKQDPPAPGTESQHQDDMPAWAKTLVESNQKLSQSLEALQKEKTQQTIQQRITGHEKMKGIPEKFWNKRQMPDKEDGIDAWVEDVEKDYTEFQQSLADQGLVVTTQQKPPVGGGTGAKADKVSPEMQAFLKQKKEAATNGQQTQKT